MNMNRLNNRFIGTCVGWPQHDIDREGGLMDMISQARDITRDTFVRNVNPEYRVLCERHLGYWMPNGIRPTEDWALSYHSSRLHGYRVYYMRWSAIEHVFGPIEAVRACICST